MNNKVLSVAALVGVVLLGGFLFLNPPQVGMQGPQGLQGLAGAVGAQGPAGPAGPMGPMGPRGFAGVAGTDASPSFGSVNGPDSFFPQESHDGVKFAYRQAGLNNASTTLCSLIAPAATSTLLLGSLNVTVGTTTALYVNAGVSTLMDATTTVIGTWSHGSLALFTDVASTTNSSSQAIVVSPNNRVNFKYAGPALGTLNVLKGGCSAYFLVN